MRFCIKDSRFWMIIEYSPIQFSIEILDVQTKIIEMVHPDRLITKTLIKFYFNKAYLPFSVLVFSGE